MMSSLPQELDNRSRAKPAKTPAKTYVEWCVYLICGVDKTSKLCHVDVGTSSPASHASTHFVYEANMHFHAVTGAGHYALPLPTGHHLGAGGETREPGPLVEDF